LHSGYVFMFIMVLIDCIMFFANVGELAKSSSDPETFLLEALRSTAYSSALKFILVIYLFYNECGKIDRLMDFTQLVITEISSL
ncbi:hypothetical protein ACJX0J_019253, partial [Zea mays]